MEFLIPSQAIRATPSTKRPPQSTRSHPRQTTKRQPQSTISKQRDTTQARISQPYKRRDEHKANFYYQQRTFHPREMMPYDDVKTDEDYYYYYYAPWRVSRNTLLNKQRRQSSAPYGIPYQDYGGQRQLNCKVNQKQDDVKDQAEEELLAEVQRMKQWDESLLIDVDTDSENAEDDPEQFMTTMKGDNESFYGSDQEEGTSNHDLQEQMNNLRDLSFSDLEEQEHDEDQEYEYLEAEETDEYQEDEERYETQSENQDETGSDYEQEQDCYDQEDELESQSEY